MKSTIKQEKRSQRKQSLSHKPIAVFLTLILLAVSFTGCDDTVISTNTGTDPDVNNHSYTVGSTLNIGFSEEDSLNPYFMNSDLNSDISSLVFEPLFYIDDSFCARNALAKSYTIKEKTLTVKLDISAAFSDGVQFSSADVVYSFNLAKQSEQYKNELLFIDSASASASDTVIFNLNTNSQNAAD